MASRTAKRRADELFDADGNIIWDNYDPSNPAHVDAINAWIRDNPPEITHDTGFGPPSTRHHNVLGGGAPQHTSNPEVTIGGQPTDWSPSTDPFGTGQGFSMDADGGGWWDRILSGLGSLFGVGKGLLETVGGGSAVAGGGALALLGMHIRDQQRAREAQQKFDQQRMNTIDEVLGMATDSFNRRAPLRAGGQQALLDSIEGLGNSPFIAHLERTGAPGEFLGPPARGGGGSSGGGAPSTGNAPVPSQLPNLRDIRERHAGGDDFDTKSAVKGGLDTMLERLRALGTL